jgi:hypothetical protein
MASVTALREHAEDRRSSARETTTETSENLASLLADKLREADDRARAVETFMQDTEKTRVTAAGARKRQQRQDAVEDRVSSKPPDDHSSESEDDECSGNDEEECAYEGDSSETTGTGLNVAVNFERNSIVLVRRRSID